MKIVGYVIKKLRPVENKIGLSLGIIPLSVIHKRRQLKWCSFFIIKLYGRNSTSLQSFVTYFGSSSIIFIIGFFKIEHISENNIEIMVMISKFLIRLIMHCSLFVYFYNLSIPQSITKRYFVDIVHIIHLVSFQI